MVYQTGFFAICFSAGLPSYVTQEEFSRFNSFWWRPVQPSPANRESAGTGRKFTLLYEVVDDSNVDVLRFPVAGSTDVEEFRFPKAGSNNSLSRLRIVQVGFKDMRMFSTTNSTLSSSLNSNHECFLSRQFGVSPGNSAIVDVETFVFDLHKFFPWLEYLVRVGWTPVRLNEFQPITDMFTSNKQRAYHAFHLCS